MNIILYIAFIVLGFSLYICLLWSEEKANKKRMKKKDDLFYELSEHIWDNALFKNRENKVITGKSDNTIEKHWNKYHSIITEYNKTKN